MKEEFLKLYDYIVNSEDPKKMHVLGQVVKSMMNRFIESQPQWASEYLDILQAVKWHNYLTHKEAEQIVSNMVPKPIWSYATWENMMHILNLPLQDEPNYNSEALYTTMQMICSDDGETLKNVLNIAGTNTENQETFFKLVHKLALNRLCDKDKMFNVRKYFNL